MNELINTLPILVKPFRNATNQRYSKQLFYEKWTELPEFQRRVRPPFTLNASLEGFVNFGREYVSDLDPTGYTTGVRLLGDYDYFKYLNRLDWFQEVKRSWDEEIEAKLYAEGMKTIRRMAEGDDARALSAAKFLVNPSNFSNRKTNKRGRPSKEEVDGLLKQEANDKQMIEDAAQRIKLVR